MIQDVNSVFSPDQSVLNFCSTATRFQYRWRKSRLRRNLTLFNIRIVLLRIEGGVAIVTQSVRHGHVDIRTHRSVTIGACDILIMTIALYAATALQYRMYSH